MLISIYKVFLYWNYHKIYQKTDLCYKFAKNSSANQNYYIWLIR